MIQKVANEQNPMWAQIPTEDELRRNSVSKSAMDSFTIQLALKVKDAIGSGHPVEKIAESMRLPVHVVAHLAKAELPVEKAREFRLKEYEQHTKIAAKQVEDDEKKLKSEYEQHLSAAEQAYNELHGTKKAQTALKRPVLGHGKSVGVASQKGDISEMGGPKKYMQYHSANSIWDASVLERNLKTKGNDERIKETNAKLKEQSMLRRQAQHTIDKDSLREMLESAEFRKDNGAYGYHAVESHNYNKNVQRTGVSIFDLWDGKGQPKTAEAKDMFTRVAAQTDGEKLREANRKARENKDRSWVQQSAPKKMTSDIFQRMIDSVLEGDE